jgi:hypothetical protein
LVFDYDAYSARISSLEPYRGKAGWLTLKQITVNTLNNQEQHLLVAASTSDGIALAEEDPEKLLRLPATTQAAGLFNHAGDATLLADIEARKAMLLREIDRRNLGYFELEVRRTATISPTLEEKLSWQKKTTGTGGKTWQTTSRIVCTAGRNRSPAQRPHRSVGNAATAAS